MQIFPKFLVVTKKFAQYPKSLLKFFKNLVTCKKNVLSLFKSFNLFPVSLHMPKNFVYVHQPSVTMPLYPTLAHVVNVPVKSKARPTIPFFSPPPSLPLNTTIGLQNAIVSTSILTSRYLSEKVDSWLTYKSQYAGLAPQSLQASSLTLQNFQRRDPHLVPKFTPMSSGAMHVSWSPHLSTLLLFFLYIYAKFPFVQESPAKIHPQSPLPSPAVQEENEEAPKALCL